MFVWFNQIVLEQAKICLNELEIFVRPRRKVCLNQTILFSECLRKTLADRKKCLDDPNEYIDIQSAQLFIDSTKSSHFKPALL